MLPPSYCVIVIVAATFVTTVGSVLLYPASTVFQLISSISLPLMDLPPPQKGFFDWGIQMNYDMPANLSSFYMVPIWNSRGHVMSKRDFQIYHFTLSQLYDGLESFLERNGFHKTCLKHSICELAQHPFVKRHQSFIADLMTFLLTPSRIQDYSNTECGEYITAEMHGLLNRECHQLYPDCVGGILKLFTEIKNTIQ